MRKQRFPQFSERDFLATIQNGGGRWGLSHGGRHSSFPFPDRGPPSRVEGCAHSYSRRAFSRNRLRLATKPWKWGGRGAGTRHHHFLLWAVVSGRCLVTMGEIMAAWATSRSWRWARGGSQAATQQRRAWERNRGGAQEPRRLQPNRQSRIPTLKPSKWRLGSPLRKGWRAREILELRLPRFLKMAWVSRRGGDSAPPLDPRRRLLWGAPWRSRRCHFSSVYSRQVLWRRGRCWVGLPLRGRASRSRGPPEP